MNPTRRSFLRAAYSGAAGLALAPSSTAAPASSRPSAVTREQYFDLPSRARLALNPLTHLLDPDQADLPYFDTNYSVQPPAAIHIRWDYGDCLGRYLDAIKLGRIMSNSQEDTQADRALEKWAEGLLGEHGLSWWPKPGYPNPHPADPPGHVADLTWTQRSAMTGFITQYQLTGDKRYASLVRGIVDGLSSVAIWRNTTAYYPREASKLKTGDVLYSPSGWNTDAKYSAGWYGAILGVVLWPLTRFVRLTGYEPALKLARGLAEYILHDTRVYRPDGRFYDLIQGHFYARTTTAGGILHLGVLTGNKELIQLAERIYNHAREWGTSFGWFPEDLSRLGCETCCVKDMIEFGIGLAIHVDPKYWDDVERFGRNHLLESQLTSIDWMRDYVAAQPMPLPQETPGRRPARLTRDRVAERSLGGFAGWGGVNDWVSSRPQMMSCCHASGARALYDLWHYSVTSENDVTSINMLFSRATPSVTVISAVPFEGRVEIRSHRPQKLRVRVPGYVRQDQVRLTVNGRNQEPESENGSLQIRAVNAGDAVVISFPLPDSREDVHLGYSSYEVTYRGNTVVAISPQGKVCPLYDREWMLNAHPATADPPALRLPEIDSI